MTDAHGHPTPPPHGPAATPPLPRIAPDVHPGRIILQTIALLVAMTVAFLAVTWLINLWTYLNPMFTMPANIRNLQVQVDPVADPQELADYKASEFEALAKYSYLNKERGVVAIPIDRAMELVAQRALPARPATRQPRPDAPGSIDARGGRVLMPPPGGWTDNAPKPVFTPPAGGSQPASKTSSQGAH